MIEMWASNYKVGKVTKFFHTMEKFFQAVERFFQAVEGAECKVYASNPVPD
jgi:hypothetical protein